MQTHGYDLTNYLQTHWPAIGPSLVGKLHFYCGDMDSFYLNLAMYRLQDFLESTKQPQYQGSFEFGRPMKGHGIRPTSTDDMLRAMARDIEKNAPADASAQAWHYN
jgi:hypothetical protein